MKTIIYILIAVFTMAHFTSCTPEDLDKSGSVPQACCDQQEPIFPTPPPPPPPTDDN